MRKKGEGNFYRRAIVRPPAPNFKDGITTANLGAPDYHLALKQHQKYCDVLRRLGIKLIELPPDPKHPDAPFVEDTAVVVGKCAVVNHMGDRRRRGEQEPVKKILQRYFKLYQIKSPGRLDGGDVLKIKDHFFIGQSKRTNREGAKQLSQIVRKEGFDVSLVPVKSVLHLKTGVSYAGNHTILLNKEFANHPAFKDYHKIITLKKENHAANCLNINGALVILKGFADTKEKIVDRNLSEKIIELDMSEYQKMDGSLTCLSILF